MGEDAYRQFYNIVNKCVNRTAYIEQCTNNIASNYFLPGCVRLCIEDTSYNPNKIEEILQFLTNHPNENLNYDFNGIKTVDELYSTIFGKNTSVSSEFNDAIKNRVSEKDDGKFVKVGNYTIYNCFTYDTIEKFVKLEDKQNSICYVGNIKSFYKDEGRYGKNAKYACLRSDYKNVDVLDINKNYPYDDYGLSLIIITVGVNGELLEVCSRWNNGAKIISKEGQLFPLGKALKNKGELNIVLNKETQKIASNYLTKEQIETIILDNNYKFEDIFKPFTKTSYNSRVSNETELKKWINNAMGYKPGKERDNFFLTTKNNINSLYNFHENNGPKLNILWLDDRREPYNYLYKKKSDSVAFLRNKSFYSKLLNKYNANFTWVKNFDEFKNFVLTNGVPDFVSFDRDLGTAPITGMDCAKWLVDYCKENGVKFPKYFVHSANVDNGQIAINNMLKNSVEENVIKITKDDILEMVTSVVNILREDAFINNLDKRNKKANITYKKGKPGWHERKYSGDYLNTDKMEQLNSDTYAVKLKCGLTSYNITDINGTQVMKYFKHYFDRNENTEIKDPSSKETFKLDMETREFDEFRRDFFAKVDAVIQHCINNFEGEYFNQVTIYPVPSSSNFNTKMAKEMEKLSFTGVKHGTVVLKEDLFWKDYKNIQRDEDFIDKNKNYYDSQLYDKKNSDETHNNSVTTAKNRYEQMALVFSYIKKINMLVKDIVKTITVDRSINKTGQTGKEYSDSLGRRILPMYITLSSLYDELEGPLERLYFEDDYTKKQHKILSKNLIKKLEYGKPAVNALNTEIAYNLVKPYLYGKKNSMGNPIDKVNIRPLSDNIFSIKSITNDIRMGLKGFFSINRDIAEKDLDPVKNTIFVIFDDNVSGGATLSDICSQLMQYGVKFIIPITFGRMRESYNKSQTLQITKPEQIDGVSQWNY